MYTNTGIMELNDFELDFVSGGDTAEGLTNIASGLAIFGGVALAIAAAPAAVLGSGIFLAGVGISSVASGIFIGVGVAELL
ncbi:hypothetical protein [Kordiimonas sp. SCSIO 12610]|uniref:hypothetical protein n=1 Tax=Kordiimonas sp. SCSIO 12610 TaxID=2829597 RepID=UPI00210DF2DA|nr:hypothetical protein [Kordiimonas sp. SCSIO 12610]UTW54517.1 hypothetical protein KFF44_11975 [Kordiimonas sp. SCSIO 12610]